MSARAVLRLNWRAVSLGASMTSVPTILVVEDEEDSVILLESAFRRAEFSNPVHRVSHGALAIEYLSHSVLPENPPVPLPALVLLDLKLPLVSGIEVLKWIRAHPLLHSMVVIIFTSSVEPRDIAEAYRAGANSYVVKPTDLSALTDLAIGIRNYWLRLNVSPKCRGLVCWARVIRRKRAHSPRWCWTTPTPTISPKF